MDSDAEYEREMALLGFGNNTPQVSITSTPIIKSTELVKLRKIGSGQYGDVYEGKCRGIRVAIKVFQSEVEIMSQNRNPNVVLCLGACIDDINEWAMITEFCENGDLEGLIHNDKKRISLSKKLRIAIEICEGMSWLTGEEVKTLHKDLKPANVLLDSFWHVKISDFGISSLESKGIVTGHTAAMGSPIYMSPEALQNKPTTYKSDVYAFGILLWELLMQKRPFESHTDIEVFRNEIVNNKMRPEQLTIHPSLYQLCSRCWHENPEVRPRVDVYLPQTLCPVAGKLWKKYFLESNKLKLPYEEFMKYCLLECNFKNDDTAIYINLIKDIFLISEKRDKLFSLNKLSKLIKWFGPLHKGNNKSYMLQQLCSVISKKWFFGLITAKQAESVIAYATPGTFLVRLNSGENTPISDSPYTISAIMSDGSPGHIRIMASKHSNGGLWCKFPQAKIPAENDIKLVVTKLMEANCISKISPGYPFGEHTSIIYMPHTGDEDEDDEEPY